MSQTNEPLKVHYERGDKGEVIEIPCKVGMADGPEDFYKECELCEAELHAAFADDGRDDDVQYDEGEFQWAMEQDSEDQWNMLPS